MAVTVTKTVGPGEDYSSLANWEAGEQRNLTSADERARALLSNIADGFSMQISGWTVDADRYIIIEAADDHRSLGEITTKAYRFVGGVFGFGLDNRMSYTRFLGIQASNTVSSRSAFYSSGSAIGVIYSDCVGVALSTASSAGFQVNSGDAALTNCFASRPNSPGAAVLSTGGDIDAYSCTSVGTFVEQSGGAVACVNCYAAGRGALAYGSGVAKTSSAADDNTGSSSPVNLQSVPYDDTTFFDVAGLDFRPAVGSRLLNVGNDTSGTPFPFDFGDDILQAARVGWTVGAWEVLPILIGTLNEATVTCKVADEATVTCKVADEATVTCKVADERTVTMPTLDEAITDIVAGDDYSIRRTISFSVSGFPTGTTIDEAWLTAKNDASDADPGLIQKIVTATDVPGTGQIEADGVGDTDMIVRFDLLPADTAVLFGARARAREFDIQVKTLGGKLYTPVRGTMQAVSQVTQDS